VSENDNSDCMFADVMCRTTGEREEGTQDTPESDTDRNQRHSCKCSALHSHQPLTPARALCLKG